MEQERKHSVWGHPCDRQTDASCRGYRDVEAYSKAFKVFGITLRGEKTIMRQIPDILSLSQGDDIPDDFPANRTYEYRCGLLKVAHVLSSRTSEMTIFLDGFPLTTLNAANVELSFDKDCEQPVADIVFRTYGTRWDDQARKTPLSVRLTFRDDVQMRELLSVHALSDPECVVISEEPCYYGGYSLFGI